MNLNAQDLRFGLSVDPIISWLNIENEQVKRKGSGLNVGYGLTMDYHFAEQYAVSSGLFFTPRAGNYEEETSTDTTGRIELEFKYLDIPLTLKLKTIEYGYLTYFAQIGVTSSIALRRRYSQPDYEIVNQRANKIATNTNLLLTIGGGTEYSLGEFTSLFAGLYFQNGFSDIVKDKDGQRISFNNLLLRAGILF